MRFFLLKKCMLLIFCATYALKCFSSTPASQPSQPLDRWEALSSSHFTIYFKSEHKSWAAGALDEAEAARALVLSKLNQVLDKKINLFVVDPYKGSNGYALPDMDQPSIVLFVTPPQSDSHLGHGISWEKLSVLHEYLHLIHLSEKYADTWKNHLDDWVGTEEKAPFSVPEWIAEGYAIHLESKLTQKGRLDNVYMKALFDEYVIKGALPSYQKLNLPAENSQSQKILYITSGLFFKWLEEKVGSKNFDEFWAKWRLDKASSFEQIFSDYFKKSAESYYQQFIALTTYSVLANKNVEWVDQNRASVIHEFMEDVDSPILSQDKKRLCIIENVMEEHRVQKQISIYEFVYTSEGGNRELRKIASQNQLAHAKIFGLDWVDDNILLYSASDQSIGGTFVDNLYAWDIRQNKVLVVKENSQVRRFDVSNDKKYIVAEKMQNGLSQLVIFKIADLEEEIALTQGGAGVRYDFPKLNQSGDQLVYLESVNGSHWQLMIYEFAKNTQYPLPIPKGLHYLSQPQWSDDETGIYFIGGKKRQINLYHYSLKNQQIEEKTKGFAPLSWPLLFPSSDIVYFASFPEGDFLISDKALTVRQPSPQTLARHVDGFENRRQAQQNTQSAPSGNLQNLMHESRQMHNDPRAQALHATRSNQPNTHSGAPATQTNAYVPAPTTTYSQEIPTHNTAQSYPSQPSSATVDTYGYQQEPIDQNPYNSQVQNSPQNVQPQSVQNRVVPSGQQSTGQEQYLPSGQDSNNQLVDSQPGVVPTSNAQPRENMTAKERAYQRFSKRTKPKPPNEIDSFLNAIIDDSEPQNQQSAAPSSMQSQQPAAPASVQNGPADLRRKPSSYYLNQAPTIGKEQLNRSIADQQPAKQSSENFNGGIARFFSEEKDRLNRSEIKAAVIKSVGIDEFFKSQKTIAKLSQPQIKSSHAIDEFFDSQRDQRARVAKLNASQPIIGLMPLPEMQPWHKKPIPAYDPIVSRFPPFDFTESALAAGGVIGNNCWKNAGKQYDIDPWLLFSLAKQRSGLEPNLISGAQSDRRLGIMQVSEDYLPQLEKYGIDESELLDPCTNIHVVAWGIHQERSRLGDSWEAVARFLQPTYTRLADARQALGQQYFSYYQETILGLTDTEIKIASTEPPHFFSNADQTGAIFFLDSTLNWTQPKAIRKIKHKPVEIQGDKALVVLEKLNALAKENNLQSQNMVYKICSSFKKSSFANKDAAIDDLYNAEIELINLRRKKFLTEKEFKRLRSWMSETRDLFSVLSSKRIDDELLPSRFCEL